MLHKAIMRSRKAQGISLTVIIIAAIALVVLVVLIAIFMGKISLWGDDYDETQAGALENVCAKQGGICRPDCTAFITPPSGGWIDCSSSQKCCT
ncbi:MAG: hypothetical protein ABH879_09305 [archaeon]